MRVCVYMLEEQYQDNHDLLVEKRDSVLYSQTNTKPMITFTPPVSYMSELETRTFNHHIL